MYEGKRNGIDTEKSTCHNECEERTIVALADAVIKPDTVVIFIFYSNDQSPMSVCIYKDGDLPTQLSHCLQWLARGGLYMQQVSQYFKRTWIPLMVTCLGNGKPSSSIELWP
jgi:hypothetical protein